MLYALWGDVCVCVCVCVILYLISRYMQPKRAMTAAPPKTVAPLFFHLFSKETSWSTGLACHSDPQIPTVGKTKETSPRPRKKRETRKAKTHPVPQHAARLARGPFLLPHGLPGAYSRVASTSISARPVAWAGGVPAGRSSPLSSWWWRLPPSC